MQVRTSIECLLLDNSLNKHAHTFLFLNVSNCVIARFNPKAKKDSCSRAVTEKDWEMELVDIM